MLVNLPEELEEGTKQYAVGDRTVSDISRRRLTLNTPSTSGFKFFALGPSSFDRQPLLDPENPLLVSTTLTAGFSSKDAAYEILLSLGHSLDMAAHDLAFGGLSGYAVGDTWVVTGGSIETDLLNALRDDQCQTLATFEDLFIGKDGLRASLWLEGRSLGKVFKTF